MRGWNTKEGTKDRHASVEQPKVKTALLQVCPECNLFNSLVEDGNPRELIAAIIVTRSSHGSLQGSVSVPSSSPSPMKDRYFASIPYPFAGSWILVFSFSPVDVSRQIVWFARNRSNPCIFLLSMGYLLCILRFFLHYYYFFFGISWKGWIFTPHQTYVLRLIISSVFGLEQQRPSSHYSSPFWTTNSGAPVWNNNSSLTVGIRGNGRSTFITSVWPFYHLGRSFIAIAACSIDKV